MSPTVVEVGDELWFYYTGFDGGHAAAEEAERPDEQRGRLPKPRSKLPCGGPSLNLATLRRDGFVSLDAIYPEGCAVTDDVRGRVRWKTGDSLAALAGKPVRFIFHMQSAKLYAFRIT